MGFGTYLDAQGNYVDQSIARSGCASGAIPANGMTCHANNGCWCFAQVRGVLGFEFGADADAGGR